MRDLTTAEMEQCAGGAPMNSGYERPSLRSIIAYDPQADGPMSTPVDHNTTAAGLFLKKFDG